MTDLDRAIEIYQQAADATPTAHPHWPYRVQLLGYGYTDKYRRTGDTAHLDKTIQLYEGSTQEPKLSGISEELHNVIRAYEESMQKPLQDNPQWIALRHSLGVAYYERCVHSRSMADLGAAIGLYQETLENPVGSADLSDLPANPWCCAIFPISNDWEGR